MRSIRWLVDYTKLDGLRLDAVKHVPAYFFGDQWAGQGHQQRGLHRPGPVAVQPNARIQRGNYRDTCSTSASRG
jgi:glycosidase